MSVGVRRPWDAVDFNELTSMFPPPPRYFEGAWFNEPEEIDRVKLVRLRDRADRAYRVPFFRRRWDAAGFEPRELHTLDDLDRVPTYTVDDIRQSIEDHPPYGDYQGVTVDQVLSEPVRIHMSGGTTGLPRPTLYTQWDREGQAIMAARGMYMQGIRAGDVVLNSWAYGLHNGAFSFDEPLHRWLNCLVIHTSTGNVTSTRKQVMLARDFQAAAILTTGDYLLRLVDEARQMGLDPAQDLSIRSLATCIGNEVELEEIFGVPVLRTYGFHEVGYVSIECPERQGLHIFEDAYHVQVVDPDTGDPVPDGTMGALVITEYYKTGSPQFRYNIMDLASLHPRERCACGSWLRRMSPFAGRGDNMVKLRGVNVWPEGIGHIVGSVEGASSDYFVRAVRTHGRDDLIAMVTTEWPESRWPELQATLERRLADQLGVKISVEVVMPGSLDALTGMGSAAKAGRFRDERDAEV